MTGTASEGFMPTGEGRLRCLQNRLHEPGRSEGTGGDPGGLPFGRNSRDLRALATKDEQHRHHAKCPLLGFDSRWGRNCLSAKRQARPALVCRSCTSKTPYRTDRLPPAVTGRKMLEGQLALAL